MHCSGKRNNLLFFILFALFCASCGVKGKREGEKLGKKYEEQDRIDLAMEQEFAMTRDPALNRVPRERLETAKAYRARLIATSRLTNLAWQERGPNNIAGRTRAIVIDKRDASGNTIFAGGVGGGIWKCTNFKTNPSWTLVTDKLNNIAVCALAQDPLTPTTMYAGTGEGWFNVDAIRGNGIFKSIDGGATWSQLASTDSATANSGVGAYNFDYIQDLVVNSTGVIFAATRSGRFCNRGGVLRSTDGGVTWTRVVGTFPTGGDCNSALNFRGADLEIAANGDMYATTGFGGTSNSLQGRIFRSPAGSDGVSGTWVDITPAGTWERIEIACAPSNPAVVYALFEVANKIGAIMRSDNSGATWQTLKIPDWCDQGKTSTDFTRGQAWYNLIAQVDPNNANTVIIGGVDLLKSTNAGSSWTQLSQWASGCTTLPRVHADQHNILFFPGSSTEFLASNDGGLYYSTNSGTAWTNRNNNYNVTQLYAVDIHPTNTNYFIIGTQDNGTMVLSSPGINTVQQAVAGGDGGIGHIDQTSNGQIQIGAFTNNNYFYTRNDGSSWFQVSGDNDEGFFINPTDYDDVLDLLYTGNDNNKIGFVSGLSGTGTPSFTEANLSGLNGRQITAIKVDPTVSAGGTAWVAGYYGGTSTTDPPLVPTLLKLTGLNSLVATVAVTSTLPVPAGAYVSSIDIDPTNGNHLIVSLSNFGVPSVLETTNGGTSWTNIEGNLPDIPVRWALIVPNSASVNGVAPGGILLGTELGVWYTSQIAGATTVWLPQSNNLPNTRIDMLRLRNSDLVLAAATHGRGLFTTTLTDLSTGVDPTPNIPGFIEYVSANKQELFINTGTLNTIKITVRIFDAKGRLVVSTDTRYTDQRIPIQHLASGVYIVKIEGDEGERFIQRFVK